MSRARRLARRLGPRLLISLPVLLAAAAALARGGGGQGYSGGSSDGGGSSGGGGDASGLVFLLLELLFRYPQVGVPLLVVVLVAGVVLRRTGRLDGRFSTGDGSLDHPASAQAWARAGASGYQLEALRQADPDFSEPLFLDFVAALVARAVAVVGTPRLVEVERYLASPQALLPFGEGGWQEVVVGSTELAAVAVAPDATRISVGVALGASNGVGGRWWRTSWTFTRAAGVRSKGPGEITRLACPSCGSAAERRDDGACSNCGQRPAPGEAAWAVAGVTVLAVEERPPVTLGGYAQEVGTDLPTIRSPTVAADLAALGATFPGFEWPAAERRFTEVFLALQRAWSARDLPAIRPLATDAVFATWRYWVEAYRAAALQNRLTDVQVTRLDPARVTLDRFYAAVTVRIFASMVDQTVDAAGRVVGGAAAPRVFTEYWTFVRTRSAATERVSCPSCGAALAAGQVGLCPYCGSLVGAGAFDWILSRIDQDEDYTGS